MGSTDPFSSKSLNNIVAGFSGDALIWLFRPIFPIIKSLSPSLSKSAAVIQFHHPAVRSWIKSDVLFWSVPFSLRNTSIPIHSPTTIKSSYVSWFKSTQIASVTIPAFFSSSGTEPTVKLPWPLLTSNVLWGVSGYRPGTIRPPTKRSKSPSWSTSDERTQEPLMNIPGRMVLVNVPCPLLI